MTMEQAVLENQALIGSVIRNLGINSVQQDYSDLHQDGNIALIKAYNSYDPDKGIKFSTFAYHAIANELKTSLQNNYNTDIGVNMPQQIHKIVELSKEGMSNKEISELITNGTRTYTENSIKRALAMYNMSYLSKDDDESNTDEVTIEGGHGDTEAFIFIDQMLQKKVLAKRQHEVLSLNLNGHGTTDIAGILNITQGAVNTHLSRAIAKIKPYYLEGGN